MASSISGNRLDLDHVCTQITQHLSCCRGGNVLTKLDYPETL
jgi:hypothetical protein